MIVRFTTVSLTSFYDQWLIRYFKSTFIASRYKYMINNECIKGEEEEQVFSGSRIRHYWFVDFLILFRGYHPLQYLSFSVSKLKVSVKVTAVQLSEFDTFKDRKGRYLPQLYSDNRFNGYCCKSDMSLLHVW